MGDSKKYGWASIIIRNAWGDSPVEWRLVSLPFDTKAVKRLREEIDDEEGQRDHYRGCTIRLGTPSTGFILEKIAGYRNHAKRLIEMADAIETQLTESPSHDN